MLKCEWYTGIIPDFGIPGLTRRVVMFEELGSGVDARTTSGVDWVTTITRQFWRITSASVYSFKSCDEGASGEIVADSLYFSLCTLL